jgi:hypothetical protein
VLRPIFLAAAFAAIALPAFAGDRFDDRHHDRRHHHDRPVRDFNRYSGDVDIYEIPGIGTWSRGSGSSSITYLGMTGIPAEPLMIDVEALPDGNECSMENGVCVIRP